MALFDMSGLASMIAQQNPVMTGLQGAQATAQTAFEPSKLKQQLQAQLLQNQVNRVKAQYAPQMAQFAAQNAQLQPAYTKAKTDMTNINIGQAPAKLQQTSDKNKIMAARQLTASMNNPLMQSYTSSKEGAPLVGNYADAINQISQLAAGGQAQQQAPAQSPAQASQAIQAAQPSSGIPQDIALPNQQAAQHPQDNAQTGIVSNTVKNMQDAQAAALDSKVTPTAIREQRFYANSLDNIYNNNMKPYMSSALKFSGPQGLASLSREAGKAYKDQSQDYKNYQSFKKSALVYGNEMRRAFGANASKEETKLMDSVANPITWKNSPKTAMQNFLTLHDTLTSLNKSLQQTPGQALGQVQSSAAEPNLASPSGVTNAIAAQYGQGAIQPSASSAQYSPAPSGMVQVPTKQGPVNIPSNKVQAFKAKYKDQLL